MTKLKTKLKTSYELSKEIRITWSIPCVTKVIENGKKNKKKLRQNAKKECMQVV